MSDYTERHSDSAQSCDNSDAGRCYGCSQMYSSCLFYFCLFCNSAAKILIFMQIICFCFTYLQFRLQNYYVGMQSFCVTPYFFMKGHAFTLPIYHNTDYTYKNNSHGRDQKVKNISSQFTFVAHVPLSHPCIYPFIVILKRHTYSKMVCNEH